MFNFAILFLPPILAWAIHIFLHRDTMDGKRKVVFGLFYFVLVNAFTYAVSSIRGVKGLRFQGMTMTYKFKYLCLGCAWAVIFPFFVGLFSGRRENGQGVGDVMGKFVHDIKNYTHYAFWSAKADLNAEVSNAYLDWLWWLIEPVCMMLIYAVMFGMVFKASEPYFPVFIFIGLTMWNFFSRCVSSSVNLIRANRSIVTKIYMPKFILLFSRMLVCGFKMMVSFGVVAVMMIIFKVRFTINILGMIPVLAVLFLFTFGLCNIFMHYGVYVNDLSYIVGIVLRMLMYLTGVFYDVGKRIPAPFGELMERYNPIAFLVSSMRGALLYGQTPDWMMLGMWTLLSVLLIIIGISTIYRNENAYVKMI
ncbi:MAG: ABC transporter permease [Clostridium sp.]|nr:ABC transporter permease [Clostridium sp.]